MTQDIFAGIDLDAELEALNSEDAPKEEPTEEENKEAAEERMKSRVVEPFDIFGDHTLTGRQEATREMFPWAIWDYAEDAARRPGLNPGPIAAGALVAAAGAIREGFRIQPKLNDPDWTEPPILWVGVTGSSGAKKTAVLKSSTAPLLIAEKISMQNAESDMKEYRRKKAVYNEEMKAWRKECQSIFKQGGNRDELPPVPEAPEYPSYERFVVQDTTTEALMKVCAANPSGVIQLRDELTGWIAEFDKYNGGRGGDRARYLEAWNNASAMKDRAGDDNGPMVVKNFGVSIFGGIQDDIIRKDFSATKHDGFLARFLFVKAEILKGEDIKPDTEKAKAYFKLISNLAGLKPERDGLITMSKEAAEIREDIEAMAIALNDHPMIRKGLSDHINKWPGIFSRLCLIFHMLKCVDKGRHPENFQVQEDTAQRAYNVLTKYFLPEAARIYHDVMQGGDEQEQQARWIAGHILAHKLERVSTYEIRRVFKSIANDDWALKKATSTLEVMAWLTPDVKKNGTPYSRADFSKMKWRVNPRVHELFADQAQAEEQRRRAEVEKIQAGASALKKLRGE